jgi:hypothetical protein
MQYMLPARLAIQPKLYFLFVSASFLSLFSRTGYNGHLSSYYPQALCLSSSSCIQHSSIAFLPSLPKTQFPSTGKYLYADANNNTLDFSTGDVSDANGGALAATLQQAYGMHCARACFLCSRQIAVFRSDVVIYLVDAHESDSASLKSRPFADLCLRYFRIEMMWLLLCRLLACDLVISIAIRYFLLQNYHIEVDVITCVYIHSVLFFDFAGGDNSSTGWIFYNDEPSSSASTTHNISGSPNDEFGHSKGVVAWDSNSGFWCVFRVDCFVVRVCTLWAVC